MNYAVKVVYQGDDGETCVEHYQNGVMSQSLATLTDGTIEKYTYFPKGGAKTLSILRPNGDYQNTWWHENGNPKQDERLQDGSYALHVHAESGVLISRKFRDADGTHGEDFYDENGNYLGYSHYEPDGDYQIVIDYPDGKRKSRESLTGGNYVKSEYDSDDHLTYEKYDDKYGNYEAFFSGGKLIKFVENGVTYTDPETLRQRATRWGIIQ